MPADAAAPPPSAIAAAAKPSVPGRKPKPWVVVKVPSVPAPTVPVVVPEVLVATRR